MNFFLSLILALDHLPTQNPSTPVVYTDGCCRGNGKQGAIGGIGVYWGPEHPRLFLSISSVHIISKILFEKNHLVIPFDLYILKKLSFLNFLYAENNNLYLFLFIQKHKRATFN